MKRLLALVVLLTAVTSCAMGQSPIPKLMLDEAVLNSGVVYRAENGVEIESGSEEDGTYLYTWYDDQGCLDGYIMQFDCGCQILFDGYGVVDEHMSYIQEGHVHEAPVKHSHVIRKLDNSLLKAVEDLIGTSYTLEELKTPAQMGDLSAQSAGLTDTVFTIDDMGYDAVFMHIREKRYQAVAQTESEKTVWISTFPEAVELADVKVIVRQGDKITYFDANGKATWISIGDSCDYSVEDGIFDVYGRYSYGSHATYDGSGNMISYRYNPMYTVRGNVGRYMSVAYDAKNRLLEFAYDNEAEDRWRYIEGDGWYFCAHDEDEDHKEIPPQELLELIPPPLSRAEYISEAVTNNSKPKEEGVTYVMVDEATAKELSEKGIKPKIEAYPPEGNRIRYDLSWVGDDGEKVSANYQANPVLAWPHGLDLAWAGTQEFVVEHTLSSGEKEMFSTADGTAQRAANGLAVSVDSFSPFELEWEMKTNDSLPQTGDSSHLFLWLGLLAASLCAFAAGRKLRA